MLRWSLLRSYTRESRLTASFPSFAMNREKNEETQKDKKIVTKHHSHFSPAGTESDSNPTAAAPSQTDITDLDCSENSYAFRVEKRL